MKNVSYPIIALIGQKSVGKSTLFNKLTKTNSALISSSRINNDNFSLTRDRQYGCVRYKQNKCVIIDTGGFTFFSKIKMQNYINDQIILAIQESHIILFLINGQCKQISSLDYNISKYLRKLKKNIFIVVSKMDGFVEYDNYMLYDYRALGIEDIFFISAIQGYGIDQLKKKLFMKISENSYYYNKKFVLNINKDRFFYESENYQNILLDNKNDQYVKLAIVGRPNSGKSTFINYVLQKNRMITSEIPGTTSDSIYVPAMYNGQQYVLVDTAGIRRKKNVCTISEQISISKTLYILKSVDIILYMIDIYEGIVDQDLSLIKLAFDYGRAVIIVVNKWDFSDLLDIRRNNIIRVLNKKNNFFNNAKIHFISSLSGNGIKMLFKSIKMLYKSYSQTISTAQLIRIMHDAIIHSPPPSLCRKNIFPKPKYVHIGRYDPMTIIVHGNQVSKFPDAYQKYLKQFFCQSLNIFGVPIKMKFIDTVNPFIKY